MSWIGRTPFTPAEDARILRLRRTLGLSWPKIATVLGRSNHYSVRARYLVLDRRELAEADAETRKAKARPRACLTCGIWFRSEGSHNRMCDPCRGGVTDSPFEPEIARVSTHRDGRRPPGIIDSDPNSGVSR